MKANKRSIPCAIALPRSGNSNVVVITVKTSKIAQQNMKYSLHLMSPLYKAAYKGDNSQHNVFRTAESGLQLRTFGLYGTLLSES